MRASLSIPSHLLFRHSPKSRTAALLPINPHLSAAISQEKTMSTSQQISGDIEIQNPRPVVRKFQARLQHEGDAAIVRRSIGGLELKYFDPFLLLDEFSVSATAGFPDHPHRGFETVTYMLQGAMTHEDFAGHKGTIKAGDLQWMTAGKGIVHTEMPASQGTQKGLQLWINLSSKHKMIEPKYQELQGEDVAKVAKDGIEVSVIAGESMGIQSPVYTRTPTMYLDFTLKPKAHLQQLIPPTWNSFVYVLEGEGIFCNSRSSPTTAHNLLLLGSGDGLEVWNNSSNSLRFIVVGGEPLGEPVVQFGPFVMNTQEEIDQTIEDYEYCINGFEKAKHWRSEALLRHDL